MVETIPLIVLLTLLTCAPNDVPLSRERRVRSSLHFDLAAARRLQRPARPPPKFAASAHDLEMRHHPGCMVLKDVAVVHPFSRSVVRHPDDADTAERGNSDRVLP